MTLAAGHVLCLAQFTYKGSLTGKEGLSPVTGYYWIMGSLPYKGKREIHILPESHDYEGKCLVLSTWQSKKVKKNVQKKFARQYLILL